MINFELWIDANKICLNLVIIIIKDIKIIYVNSKIEISYLIIAKSTINYKKNVVINIIISKIYKLLYIVWLSK